MNYPGIKPIKTDLTLDGRIILECVHADTCLPDYWPGHHLPHISVPVYNGMTLKALKQALKSELAQGCVMGSDNAAMLLSADYVGKENEKLADKLTAAAYAAINRIRPARKGQRALFKDLPKEEEDQDYSVYAYFVFRDLN